jgi:hypothetical protein
MMLLADLQSHLFIALFLGCVLILIQIESGFTASLAFSLRRMICGESWLLGPQQGWR